MIKYLIILLLITGCSQNNKLKVGTFELQEDGVPIGKIYRLNKYQIEEYSDGSLLFANLHWKSDSSFIIIGLEKDPKGIDTVSFLVKLKKTSKDEYALTSEPYYLKSSYTYKGVLIKKSSDVKKEYLDTLIQLNKNGHR
ncbi:hypothetical protein [Hanstruepera ponticola]|uniref:hypothetical protein n=1 Tax=Hanstruepera ponticola TaxID=2042995 RepID=UPI000CF05504|nr:hypothetical protein [Hanstruepera ponticola]